MTEIEQKIAIAKACGWTTLSMPEECPPAWTHPVHRDVINDYYLPDYLNDLNAMHEAVETLFESSLYQDYWPMLDSIAQRDGNRGSSGRIAHTTAKQQAEAFLCVRNRDKS